MARFTDLPPHLDPYAIESNVERVVAVQDSQPTSSHAARRPDGLSVIVLNLDQPKLLEQLHQGWTDAVADLDRRGVRSELIIGDTGSSDSLALEILDRPTTNCRVLRDLKYHFSRCNNDLFDQSKFDTVLFMNNDVLLRDEPRAIALAYEALQNDDRLAAVGSILFFDDGTVQHAGIDFFESPDLYGFCYHPGAGETIDLVVGDSFDAPAVTGAFLMVRASDFSAVGGFDESYSAECQDVDLCLRLRRRGRHIRVVHTGQLVHLENGTRELGEENWRDRSLFVRRWSSFLEAT